MITSHPEVDMVSFTGSTGVGKLTMTNAAQTLKKVSLETGRQEPADRVRRMRISMRSPMRRSSAPISTPANAAMRAPA